MHNGDPDNQFDLDESLALVITGNGPLVSHRASWGILPQTPVFSLRSARCHWQSSITALTQRMIISCSPRVTTIHHSERVFEPANPMLIPVGSTFRYKLVVF